MSRDAREAAIERVIAEYRPYWETMNLTQRSSALERISVGAGITRAEALQRVSRPPCPHCGSTDLDRGEVDACRVCGKVSREGVAVG